MRSPGALASPEVDPGELGEAGGSLWLGAAAGWRVGARKRRWTSFCMKRLLCAGPLPCPGGTRSQSSRHNLARV